MSPKSDQRTYRDATTRVKSGEKMTKENLAWLEEQMPPYFAITMQDEVGAVGDLAARLQDLKSNKRIVLADRDDTFILARLNRPGSLYETLQSLEDKEITYSQTTQSREPIPGTEHKLEVLRFEFRRKTNEEINNTCEVMIPTGIEESVAAALKQHYPRDSRSKLDRQLQLLWLNNENYVRISPARRIAQTLWLYAKGNDHGGIYLDIEETEEPAEEREYRIMFAVGNPPRRGFLQQIFEVFNRLNIGVNRAYNLNINNGIHPYFLGTFYVRIQENRFLAKETELYNRLKKELYNIQILRKESFAYENFVTEGIMTGEEASLVNAFIAFCHTQLAPDPYDFEDVMRAFNSHPDMSLQLVELFRVRFDPEVENRDTLFRLTLEKTAGLIEEFNTGRRYIDRVRRVVFRCCLTFIKHTLKTNFFVPEKHALSFRLDPAYLKDLDPQCVSDLPEERPFRITFFFARYGCGFHIGFSDIARGGWRTIITDGRDDYVTNASTLFKEVYVLAHTQHLKNKDIYEGGSKMGAILVATDLNDKDLVTQRLYRLQHGFINAFFDIFVTENGQAKDPHVIDYYGEDEAIELGPDENMHNSMIEHIAKLSTKRGYMLGAGVMSSKQVGINHKEYGVTSAGVVKFAEIAMREQGVDIHHDPFSVKFTGGPNGDVAGNAMRLLLERCPKAQIRLVLDGTGAVYDPQGVDHTELQRILLQNDVEDFAPQTLKTGGFMLFRSVHRKEGLRKLYKKIVRTDTSLAEEWLTQDEFNREFNSLPFCVETDLFIPAGGRPETINDDNWQKFFNEKNTPTARVIVEGANSFLTPEARTRLQQKGIVIMRDASANKCGVISSSYEIIANLLLSDEEFIADKERYVSDVLDILEQRAGDEAELIFRRHRETGNRLSYTEISDSISMEINTHYARLFSFFQQRPHLCEQSLFDQVMLEHLPRIIKEKNIYRQRLQNLPAKYQYAILASEIASSLIYRGDRDAEFEEMLTGHLKRSFPSPDSENILQSVAQSA